MKKRVRTQPTNPYYNDEPAVAKSLMADKGLVQNASLGNSTPKMVDKKPARLSGLAGFTSKTKPSAGGGHISSPKLGIATSFPTQGKLRMSGHPGAHRLGGGKLKI